MLIFIGLIKYGCFGIIMCSLLGIGLNVVQLQYFMLFGCWQFVVEHSKESRTMSSSRTSFLFILSWDLLSLPK